MRTNEYPREIGLDGTGGRATVDEAPATRSTDNTKSGESLVMRPATMEDLEQTVELFNACSRKMIGRPNTTRNEVRMQWSRPGFDLGRSTLLVEAPTGQTVGLVEVWDIVDPPASVWVYGRVHPEYEGLGIGSRLMQWAELRAQEAISRVPEDVRVVMRAGSTASYEPARELLDAFGMSQVRRMLTMVTRFSGEVEEPKWPEGIEVRPMSDESDLPAVVRTDREAFQDHWGYVERPYEEAFEQWLHYVQTSAAFDPSLWFLAMDGDEVAGISLCELSDREDPTLGFVETLGVRRAWRRRGLGLALLQHSFAELKRRGKQGAKLGVDGSSLTGATGLYKKAGMRTIREFVVYEKELRPGKEMIVRSLDQDQTALELE